LLLLVQPTLLHKSLSISLKATAWSQYAETEFVYSGEWLPVAKGKILAMQLVLAGMSVAKLPVISCSLCWFVAYWPAMWLCVRVCAIA
jgi:hypothetical protein